MENEMIIMSKKELTELIQETVKTTLAALNPQSTKSKEKEEDSLKNYLKSKIGVTLHKSICTGNKFFTDVYTRRYSFNVIKVFRNKVTIEVGSIDICPSGLAQGGSSINLGEIVMDFKKYSKEELLNEIIAKKDANFLIKYHISLK